MGVELVLILLILSRFNNCMQQTCYFTALNQSSLEINHVGSVFTRVAWAVIKESPDII